MPFEEIKDVGDNAFKGGFLDRKYCDNVVDHCNLWHHWKVIVPSSSQGSAKFTITEDSAILDLSKLKLSATESFPLQVMNASDTVAKVRVRSGYVSGRLADSTMTADDSTVFKLTLPYSGWNYIYCEVTVAYDSATSIWTSSACAIIADSSATKARTATKQYVLIGAANRSGATVIGLSQVVSGNQWAVRYGSTFATVSVDANGLI